MIKQNIHKKDKPNSKRSGSQKFPGKHKVEGILKITSKGLGLVVVEGMKDVIEINPADLNTGLDGDRVMVILHGKPSGRRQTGQIKSVILRNKTAFTGILENENGFYYLTPDDSKLYKQILIPQSKLKKSKVGEKVLVEILSWDDPFKNPIGYVKEIIGTPGDNTAEMKAIVLEKGFSWSHNPLTIAAAEKIDEKISEDEIKKRRDFRKITTFTIDPFDAKDFDDALSVDFLQDGNIEVGVHIADVSHFVHPGDAIDKEAFERATSIYLVDRTIPMLPERLSNNLCSLVPNQDRLTMSAVFVLNKKAEIVSEWFGKTIIHSDKRFTYEEAQEIIEIGKGTLSKEVLKLNELARILKTERIKNGAIDFEADEVKFKLDDNGKPISVYKKVMKDSNKLIEEFMLLANKRVAKFLSDRDPRTEKAFVYRVHDVPNEERMQDLSAFLETLGVSFKKSKKTGEWESKDINEMLKMVQGKSEAAMIQIATVRSMAKAVYTTKNIGHYGLGFEYYTHFTSPIRRYPDLMVHRLLQSELIGEKVSDKVLSKQEHLARYCSQMEVEASEAERTSIRFKQCEFFQDRIGTLIEGSISGVTEWGIYIEDSETKTEGMIHIKDLPNDYFFYEEKNYRLVGKNTKASFRLGDKVKAEISGVNLKKKQIDMKLVWHSDLDKLVKK